MIEMAEMAELMDDNIVPFFRREESDAILERKIADTGTAAEPSLLIPDAYLSIPKSVPQGKFAHAPLDDALRLASPRRIRFATRRI
jgi:hypothetical protein